MIIFHCSLFYSYIYLFMPFVCHSSKKENKSKQKSIILYAYYCIERKEKRKQRNKIKNIFLNNFLLLFFLFLPLYLSLFLSRSIPLLGRLIILCTLLLLTNAIRKKIHLKNETQKKMIFCKLKMIRKIK